MGSASIAKVWAGLRSSVSPDSWPAGRAGNWRIAAANGALLAAYLVPAWTVAAARLYLDPVDGLFDDANVAFAILAGDHLQLAPGAFVRFALFLGLARIIVAVFFASFVWLSILGDETFHADRDECLHIGLTLAAVVSVAGMLLAYRFGEAEAMRLHATETLMIVAAAVVAIIDEPRRPADIPADARSADPLVQDNKDWPAAA